MGLIKKLQYRLLKRDINKNKSYSYLAKKYPMSMLVEVGEFHRYKNTELYYPNFTNSLYSVDGEFLGYLQSFAKGEESKYLVLSRENSKTFLPSVAVYDMNGDCVVPHDCYNNVYLAKDYAILTMPMEKYYAGIRVRRDLKSIDETTTISATGKTLEETLGGSLLEPRVLIVSKDKIINTKYLSVEPLDIPQYNVSTLENNTIWIGQTENKEEITFKLDKRLHITETYRLPYFSHEDDIFFAEEKKNAVYFLNTEDKTRINLRTGERVNLLNLKKEKLSKKQRFAQPEKENAQQDAILAFDDTVISLPQDATFEESTEIPPISEDEIGEYDPSLDQ
ncbi:MAG: hypothetical protein J6Q13_00825 [Clostridia bacterium]|nr:hypothetical protein [Clostridia bacterium]